MVRVSFISSTDINHVGVKHIMLDEFFGDFDSFKEETKEEVRNFISDKETVWVAMSHNYYGYKKLPVDVDLEEHLKSQFPPGFKVAKMDC